MRQINSKKQTPIDLLQYNLSENEDLQLCFNTLLDELASNSNAYYIKQSKDIKNNQTIKEHTHWKTTKKINKRNNSENSLGKNINRENKNLAKVRKISRKKIDKDNPLTFEINDQIFTVFFGKSLYRIQFLDGEIIFLVKAERGKSPKGSFGQVVKCDQYFVKKNGNWQLVTGKAFARKWIPDQRSKYDSETNFDRIILDEYSTNAVVFDNKVAIYRGKKAAEIFMPYVPGLIMDEFNFTQLLEFKKFYYISRLAKAYKELHKKNVVHCDMKPDNVLFDLDSKTFYPVDFGLSFVGDYSEVNGGGNPAFISPECLKKPLRRDKYSDVFSFGCLLLETFFEINLSLYAPNNAHIKCGELIPKLNSYHKKIRNLIPKQIENLSTNNKGILKSIFANMLAEDPKQRPLFSTIQLTFYVLNRLEKYKKKENQVKIPHELIDTDDMLSILIDIGLRKDKVLLKLLNKTNVIERINSDVMERLFGCAKNAKFKKAIEYVFTSQEIGLKKSTIKSIFNDHKQETLPIYLSIKNHNNLHYKLIYNKMVDYLDFRAGGFDMFAPFRSNALTRYKRTVANNIIKALYQDPKKTDEEIKKLLKEKLTNIENKRTQINKKECLIHHGKGRLEEYLEKCIKKIEFDQQRKQKKDLKSDVNSCCIL